MGVKGERRSWPSILSCFGVSHRRQKLRWSRFRANKQTVPLDATIETDIAEKNADDSKEKIKPSKVSTTKKGFFKRFQKDKSITHTTKRRHKSAACHVISNCNTQIQIAPPVQVSPKQKEIKINQKSLPSTKSNLPPKIWKTRNNNKKKKVDKIDIRDGLVVLAMILVVMLFGGRMVAIACMSAWFYILPYFSTTNMKNYERNKRFYSIDKIDISSEQYKKRVVLQGLLERN